MKLRAIPAPVGGMKALATYTRVGGCREKVNGNVWGPEVENDEGDGCNLRRREPFTATNLIQTSAVQRSCIRLREKERFTLFKCLSLLSKAVVY
jgi:hypothetical protein